MLKITITRDELNALRVYLCGRLTGEYVSELETALSAGAAPRVILDMSGVTFVDREAMEYLCGARSRISIENIPSYVNLWIEQEFRCGASKNSRGRS